jgi:hypothetical protein
LQIEYKKKQSFCVVPKMEYLPEYGAQCLTPGELTHQWISLYVRPGAELYRGMLICFMNELYLITLNVWGITLSCYHGPLTPSPFLTKGTENIFTFNVSFLYYCGHRQSDFNSVCEVFVSCGVLIGVAEDPSLLGCDAVVLGA